MHKMVMEMRMRRLLRGWSQADLALAVGVSPWRIFRLERGVCQPREEELKRIAEVLGVDGARNYSSVLGNHDEQRRRSSEPMLPFDDVTLEDRRDE